MFICSPFAASVQGKHTRASAEMLLLLWDASCSTASLNDDANQACRRRRPLQDKTTVSTVGPAHAQGSVSTAAQADS
ncbi:hypothetical protein L209DRAFT_750580 [Thermothelomyces heterothallicus CBS 203.75]